MQDSIDEIDLAVTLFGKLISPCWPEEYTNSNPKVRLIGYTTTNVLPTLFEYIGRPDKNNEICPSPKQCSLKCYKQLSYDEKLFYLIEKGN